MSKNLKIRRVMVTRYGYAEILSESDEDALETVKNYDDSDFDWEPLDGDMLNDAEVVDEWDSDEEN